MRRWTDGDCLHRSRSNRKWSPQFAQSITGWWKLVDSLIPQRQWDGHQALFYLWHWASVGVVNLQWILEESWSGFSPHLKPKQKNKHGAKEDYFVLLSWFEWFQYGARCGKRSYLKGSELPDVLWKWDELVLMQIQHLGRTFGRMGIKGCISDVGWRHFCWRLKRDPKQTEPACPSLPCFMRPVKTILNAVQNPTTPAPCRWLVGILFILVLSGW